MKRSNNIFVVLLYLENVHPKHCYSIGLLIYRTWAEGSEDFCVIFQYV